MLDNWQKYRDAGVNISIGSDTYPRDMIMNMRTASYLGKVMSHTYFAATAGEVFEAATLGGARSVGRDDLGRLAPGALADIIIIDLTGGNTLRYGPVRDPVKSVVECGVGDDVDTVIVDGKICMQDGVIPGVDFRQIRAETQAAGEAIWATFPIGTRSDARPTRPARIAIPTGDRLGTREPQSGMLPCFFHGRSSVLCRNMTSARATLRRVACGMMTAST